LQNKIISSESKDSFKKINDLNKPGIYTHITSPPVSTICYYGKEKMPLKTWNSINQLLPIRNFLFKLNHILPSARITWVAMFDQKYIIFSGNVEKQLSKFPHDSIQSYTENLYKRLQRKYSNKYNIKNYSKWGYWTDPFIDFASNKKAVAVKFPIFNNSGKLIGVSGVYIDLELIIKDSIKPTLFLKNKKSNLFKKGFSIIFTDNTQVVYASDSLYRLLSIPIPKHNLTMPFKFFMPSLSKSTNPVIKEIAEEIQKNLFGCRTVEIDNKLYLFAYSRIKTNNWICAKLFPLKRASQFVIKTEKKTGEVVSGLGTYYITTSIICLLGAILLSGLFFWFCIHSPIVNLCRAVKKFHNGNFETKLKKRGISELQELTDSYNELGDSLKLYMYNLKEEVKNRQSVETEIAIAAEIQKSVMPKITDIPPKEEFELAAKLKPAKHVAGDFFDYFFIDDDRIVFIIGDVSGKGISAAFFMTTAKVIIKNICYKTDDPATILKDANEQLTHNNETGLFVTIFLCIYDLKTGNITYSNGGHHEAIILSENSKISEFGLQEKPPLGFFNDSKYITATRKLNIGETIILYTDGITEAYDPEDNKFLGKNNFFKIIEDSKTDTLNRFIKNITATVINFERKVLFDDITILAFKRNK
jgi:serine phosphatase RsbU (regulator of sigma subunit)